MERKPLELIKELQRKNSELEKTKKRLEYQIQEMINKSAQRSAEMDQKITELEIKIRDLEYENRELKSDKREMNRKRHGANASTIEESETIDLDADEENEENSSEPPNLLDPMPSQFDSHYGEQRVLPFSCNICGKSYIQKKRLETHMKLHDFAPKSIAEQKPHPGPTLKQDTAPPLSDKKKKYSCTEKGCGYSTTFFPVMVRHKKTHISEMLSCDFYMCDYKTTYRKRYYNHMASKHGASMSGMENEERDDDEQFKVFQEFSNQLISSSMQENP